MPYLFRVCEFDMDHEAYIKFILSNHQALNLPYPFHVKLSFAGSPLVLGKAMLVIEEESYELVGAAGFVFGTGANDHQDRHVCQAELAFVLPEHRKIGLFVQGLRALLDAAKEGNPEVEWFQFWCPGDREKLPKLFIKLLSLPGADSQTANGMTLLRLPFAELAAYVRTLRFGSAKVNR
ncbi:hypothetical protein DFP98_12981 [Cohnella phaseoli]|uniref:Acetyltransferase (GNAT) family protein n=2 Tax=Paenibacillaceae TaxID=186822 RepID=A0A3D9IFZ7_9BACL|nr:hypothetical protein DFP98_12981 [Cohnella phaseoli]